MNKVIGYLFLLLVLVLFGWYLDYLMHDTIVLAGQLTLITVTGTGLVLLVIASTIGALVGIERFRMLRSQRRQMDKEASVLTVIAHTGEQVFIRDTDHKAVWRAAHLDGRVYANGRYSEPSGMELNNWQYFNAPTARINANLLLNPPTQQQPIDLLTALDNQQRVLIVGASDSGKTTLLMHIIGRKLNTSKTIVIDPHSYPGKYPAGAAVIGMGRNYQEIDNALTALVRLMTKRYDEIGRGVVAELHHSKISIFIDEWRAITANVKNSQFVIRSLLTESRKAAFSLYVTSHSERVRPLGIEHEGDLKDGFCMVRLQNINGNRQATIDLGAGEIPASLPGPYQTVTEVIDNGDFELLAPQEPSQEETRILELHRAGESFRTITKTVYGNVGQHYNNKISKILEKYGEK